MSLKNKFADVRALRGRDIRTYTRTGYAKYLRVHKECSRTFYVPTTKVFDVTCFSDVS